MYGNRDLFGGYLVGLVCPLVKNLDLGHCKLHLSVTNLKYLFMVLVTFFFVCGSIGVWSVIVDNRVFGSYPGHWVAELSVEVVGIIFLLLATLVLVPQLEVIAAEGEKKR
jgi:hypothetical protein